MYIQVPITNTISDNSCKTQHALTFYLNIKVVINDD